MSFDGSDHWVTVPHQARPEPQRGKRAALAQRALEAGLVPRHDFRAVTSWVTVVFGIGLKAADGDHDQVRYAGSTDRSKEPAAATAARRQV